ncbi:hypothetical protein M9458_009326, partial [Cirrhinus mrigala]
TLAGLGPGGWVMWFLGCCLFLLLCLSGSCQELYLKIPKPLNQTIPQINTNTHSALQR